MSKISTKAARTAARSTKSAPPPVAPTPEPETPKKLGRPPIDEPRVTISFRVPQAVQASFEKLADDETKAKPGRVVKPSELYNEALASFLQSRGVTIEGWND